MKVVLAHDWLVGLRGGEWVLDRFARGYGPTTLYTLVNDGRGLTDAIDRCRIVTSPLQRLPGAAGRWRRHYLPLMPWAVQRLRVEPCDVLLSTSSAVMKSIIPPRGVPHVCYCHSPARYIWEQTRDYGRGAGGLIRALGLRSVRGRFQRWDRETASRVTLFVTNSRHTAARIERCFEREARVVHPPVRTDFFTPDESARGDGWYLVVSALEPYKRVDLVIGAANRRGLRVKIAGTGSQARALRKRAGPTVELLGRVTDEELRTLYRGARALIFPQVEDFGITAVEAQAAGTPVVAFAAGGALDTVSDEIGVLFERQDEDALIAAVERLEQRSIPPDACRANAERFGEARFDHEIRTIVDEVAGS